jgi:hypothetical protein
VGTSTAGGRTMTARGAVFLGAGSTVDAGIFSLLGEAGAVRVRTLAVVLLLVNLVDLAAIASLGSVVALALFVVTALAAFRLRAEIGARARLLVTGVALTVFVMAVVLDPCGAAGTRQGTEPFTDTTRR